MAKSYSTLFFSLAVLGIIWCCTSLKFSGDWSIDSKYTPSTSSRYYVLNDWHNTYSQDQATSPIPAAKISDIMLKTMGILRDGANWPGVLLGNLFSRPLATALFLVDGISPESTFELESTSSFQVDQTGLTGCTCGDAKLMFSGDHVARHMSDLFDQNSQTSSVSANVMAAQTASANGAYTSSEQLNEVIEDVKLGRAALAKYGLEAAATKLEPTNEVDAKFVAELILVKQTMEQLKELPSYVQDHSPDVFIFTISALEAMEKRYGKGSSKMGVAMELVKQVIQESSKALVDLYDGKVLVQALVLEWNHPDMDISAPELEKAYHLLLPFLAQKDHQAYLSSLPRVVLKEEYSKDSHLCANLRIVLEESSFYVHCPQTTEQSNLLRRREAKSETRKKRADKAADASVSQTARSNLTVTILAEDRSNSFSAVFLITLFITVSLGLALYAASWVLWNMDPGRDSIIYRQVSDPTVRMQ